jgi:hypothetical protein
MIKVTRCGGKGIGRRKINLSTVFAGQYIAVREAAEAICVDLQLKLTQDLHLILTHPGRQIMA